MEQHEDSSAPHRGMKDEESGSDLTPMLSPPSNDKQIRKFRLHPFRKLRKRLGGASSASTSSRSHDESQDSHRKQSPSRPASPSNLSILEDLQHIEDPSLQDENTMENANILRVGVKVRRVNRNLALIDDEGDILDAIVDTTKTIQCGKHAGSRKQNHHHSSVKKDGKRHEEESKILQDLASAEVEWIHENGINI